MYNNRLIVLAAAVALPCFLPVVSPTQAAQATAPAVTATATGSGASRLLKLYSGRRSAQGAGELSVNVSQPKLKRPRRNGKQPAAKVRRRAGRTRPGVSPEEVARYRTLVSSFAREYGVPVDLAHAIVTVESNYHPKAQGSAGEVGLMQIKPATARGMGYKGPKHGLFHPETNVRYGMKYLATAYRLGGKTTCGAVLKYNAGHGAKRMNPISSAYCAKVKRLLKK